MKNHANMRTGVGSRPRADEIIIDGGADALLSARAAAARIGSRNPTQLTAMEKRPPDLSEGHSFRRARPSYVPPRIFGPMVERASRKGLDIITIIIDAIARLVSGGFFNVYRKNPHTS